MSDYLDNLVSRSLDQGEVVQPRPVSLFEASPVVRGPAFGHLAGLETSEDEGISDPTGRETPAPAPDFRGERWLNPPPPIPAGAATESRPGHPPRTDTPTLAQDSRPYSPQPPPGPTPRRDYPTAQPPAPLMVTHTVAENPSPQPVPYQPEPPDASAPAKEAASETTLPALEPVIRQVVIEREALPSAPTETIRVETKVEPVALHPEPLIQPPAALPVVQPQITPYVEPPSPRFAEPAVAPEAAPTVHVTIGRVEVRATPPPSPVPKKQRTRAPVMSLDEYLRQRANGSQR